MRHAILDLGTNTFHLFIADQLPGNKFRTLFKSKVSVKLGEGEIHKNRIGEVPFRRGIEALIRYRTIIDRFKPDTVSAFATSAIRTAKNGAQFILDVFEETGIQVTTITGKEEARLIYLGVQQAVQLSDEPVLIVDIGGGSTEFIIANHKKIFAKHSFKIGAARLLELFTPSDPIRANEIRKINSFLLREIQPLLESVRKFPVHTMIGSSGSFDTYAEMIGHRYHGKNLLRGTTHYRFNLSEYRRLHEGLLSSTIAQRAKMKGLISMRRDMIVLASVCTMFIIRKFKIREMLLSKYALKEGAMLDVIRKSLLV